MCSRASTSKSGKARWSPSWERRGSGRSTLLNILGILDDYDSGEYFLDGKPIKNLSETKAAEYRDRMIGFIFQSFDLISYKNAMENVALPLYYQGVPRRKRNAMALEPSSTGSDCAIGPTTCPTRCREDRSSAWRSPAR